MNITLTQAFKCLFLTIGGWIGWLVGEFSPTFPLIIVMIAFVLYDAYSAYLLDKRVKKKYPDKAKRREAKFKSYAFSKVVRKTIPERIALIILAFLAQKYVFLHVEWHLEYMMTGLILFEQMLSVAENMASCNDTDSRFWNMVKKVLIDKTIRHLDVEFRDEYEKEKELEEEKEGEIC